MLVSYFHMDWDSDSYLDLDTDLDTDFDTDLDTYLGTRAQTVCDRTLKSFLGIRNTRGLSH